LCGREEYVAISPAVQSALDLYSPVGIYPLYLNVAHPAIFDSVARESCSDIEFKQFDLTNEAYYTVKLNHRAF